MSRSIPWESPNGLESSEDRGSAGRHGNQHVRLRCAQVRLTTCRGFDGEHRRSRGSVRDAPGAHTIWTAYRVHARARAGVRQCRKGLRYRAIFGFMIGTDVGNPGEREFQTQTTGRFGKGGGTYRALWQEVEIEIVPLPNFRIGRRHRHAARHHRRPDIDDRRQFNFQGACSICVIACLTAGARHSDDCRRRRHGDRVDEISGAKGRMYGTDLHARFRPRAGPDSQSARSI